MSWTYDASLIDADTAIGRRYIVRLMIADTDTDDQQLQDEEIDYFLDKNSDSIRYAAMDAVRALIAKYSRAHDERMGHTEVKRSQMARAYISMLETMESDTTGMDVQILMGGQSRAEKAELNSDTDAILPGTMIGQDDMWEQ
jgi:hypothetical protein